MFKNATTFARRHATKAVAFATLAAGNAMAAVDTSITTAISDGTADGKVIAGGILALIIAVGIFKHIRRGA